MESPISNPVACPACKATSRKFGTNRNGSQRFQCLTCKKTFSAPTPLGTMRLPLDVAVLALQLIIEGNSLRSTTRIARVNLRTAIDLLVLVGERCETMLEGRIQGLPVVDVQCDEIWSFVGMKEKTRLRKHPELVDSGDCYCFTAIERETKLMLAWHVGIRTPEDTACFADKLAAATSGQFQVTTDGFTPYAHTIPAALPMADFAQLVKNYATKSDGRESKYSPGEVTGTVKLVRNGSPDMAKVCTSHVERHNLTIRMQNRRLTRLTNGFSKKWENHAAAFALQFAYYNFCRVHETLTDATKVEGKAKVKTTPAMAAGLADHPWTLEELVRNTMPATD